MFHRQQQLFIIFVLISSNLSILLMEASKQTENRIKKMTNQLINQIEKDIQDQVLSVNDKPVNINQLTRKRSKKDLVRNLTNKDAFKDLESLEELRKSKLVELRELERHEDILKKSALLTNSNVSRSFSKLLRSEYTEQQMKKVKQVLKKQKEFANQLERKQKELADFIAEKQNQDQQLRNKIIAQKCEQRKNQLRKQREELERKKIERKINFQIQIKKLKELKQIKLLHQTMEQKFDKTIQQIQKEKEKAYQLQKQRKKKVLQGIEEHQKKYLQLKKQRQLHRQSSIGQNKFELPTLQSKIWLKLQKKQEEQQKIKQWEQNLITEHLKNQKDYSKKVKQLFCPRMKLTNCLTVRQEISEARKRLDSQEHRKLGNDYMKMVHQGITENDVQKLKKSLEQVDSLGGHSAFYKNYLTDLKTQSKYEELKLNSSAFEQTAANQNLTQQQKLIKMKKMLKLKQRKAKRDTDSQIVDSIKSKLLVLNEMIR